MKDDKTNGTNKADTTDKTNETNKTDRVEKTDRAEETDRVEETDRADICHRKHWHSYCLKEININDVAYSQINIYICR